MIGGVGRKKKKKKIILCFLFLGSFDVIRVCGKIGCMDLWREVCFMCCGSLLYAFVCLYNFFCFCFFPYLKRAVKSIVCEVGLWTVIYCGL